MMGTQFLLIFAVIVVVLPTASFATFIVGDDAGWNTKTDYVAWAKGKEFRVGDKLVFKYAPGLHNVYQVNEDGYKNCKIPQDRVFASGEDTITLDTPGPKYFVCGVGLHCENGQKLSVIVNQGDTKGLTKETEAKPPSQSSAAPTPNAAPSKSPVAATNESPIGAPSESSDDTDSSNEEASPPPVATSNSPNGLVNTGYQLCLAKYPYLTYCPSSRRHPSSCHW